MAFKHRGRSSPATLRKITGLRPASQLPITENTPLCGAPCSRKRGFLAGQKIFEKVSQNACQIWLTCVIISLYIGHTRRWGDARVVWEASLPQTGMGDRCLLRSWSQVQGSNWGDCCPAFIGFLKPPSSSDAYRQTAPPHAASPKSAPPSLPLLREEARIPPCRKGGFG